MGFPELSAQAAGGRETAVVRDKGELSAEGLGDEFAGSKGAGTESDGLLGGWEGLPDRDLRRDQNLEGFRWRLRD